MRLHEKVCVVTGAAQGIGLAVARRFATEGASVVLCDVDGDKVERAADDLRGHGAMAMGCPVDVALRSSVDDMVAATLGRFRGIDVLVNNAGITRDARLVAMTQAQWDAVIDVNLNGVFHCTQAVVQAMLGRGTGAIVNVSSVSGVHGNFGQGNYAASKAALLGLTKTWARELGPKGWRVNAVVPGSIGTPMLDAVPPNVRARIEQSSWLQRIGRPEELANAILFLAGDEASYVNGTSLEVSGGVSI